MTRDEEDRDEDDRVLIRTEYTDRPTIWFTIVQALAVVEDTVPQSLPPLGDSIDLEALEKLVQRADETGEYIEVTFPFESYQVVVRTGGTVLLKETTC